MTIVDGAKPCFFSSLRINRFAQRPLPGNSIPGATIVRLPDTTWLVAREFLRRLALDKALKDVSGKST